MSWNVNGIAHLLPKKERKITSFFGSRARRASTPHSSDEENGSRTRSGLRAFLKRHAYPGIVCLQEVHISPQDEGTKEAVRKAANEGAGNGGVRYEVHFSLPRDKFNARGLGGRERVHGVCTLISSSLTSSTTTSTKPVDWDLEGRVLVTSLPNHKLVVINGYWPNGTTFPYRDGKTGVVVGTRHEFKRTFHDRMLREVKSYEQKGWDVVLIGDMNIAPTPLDGYPSIRLGAEHVKNRAGFNWKFLHKENERGMRGVDSWRHFHGGRRGYSYHGEKVEEWGRSCDRVDLGVVSRGLVERGALVGAGIWESVLERGGSDHVPIGVTLDLGKMGGREGEEERINKCHAVFGIGM